MANHVAEIEAQLRAQLQLLHSLTKRVANGGGGGITQEAADARYAAIAHSQAIASVTGLQAALDAKADSGHTHGGVYQPAGSYAAQTHGHAISDVTGLQTALDGKQPAGSYAAASHTHPATNINDSTAAGRAMLTAADVAAQTALLNVATTLLKGLVPAPATATGRFLRDDLTWAAAPAGSGSDPWTYVRLSSDFTTSSATAVDVTGLAFTPAANKFYEVEGLFLTRTATATVGPRPGVAWPTGLTDGVAAMDVTSSATAKIFAQGNINAAVLCPVGGLPNTNQSWPATLWATMQAGATPAGTFKVQLASETAGTVVTMKAGSWIRYREVP